METNESHLNWLLPNLKIHSGVRVEVPKTFLLSFNTKFFGILTRVTLGDLIVQDMSRGVTGGWPGLLVELRYWWLGHVSSDRADGSCGLKIGKKKHFLQLPIPTVFRLVRDLWMARAH